MQSAPQVQRYAEMLSALGHEARLLIVRALFSAHPHGLVAGEIGAKLEIAPSTLSHHLDTLARAGLVQKRREGTFLRYTAAVDVLGRLLAFLLSDCCSGVLSQKPRRKQS